MGRQTDGQAGRQAVLIFPFLRSFGTVIVSACPSVCIPCLIANPLPYPHVCDVILKRHGMCYCLFMLGWFVRWWGLPFALSASLPPSLIFYIHTPHTPLILYTRNVEGVGERLDRSMSTPEQDPDSSFNKERSSATISDSPLMVEDATCWDHYKSRSQIVRLFPFLLRPSAPFC
jgi:hypothetical protein